MYDGIRIAGLFLLLLGLMMTIAHLGSRVTCVDQAQGSHEHARVLNRQGTGPWPPIFGHAYEEECLVMDTGTFVALGQNPQGGTRYRYASSHLLPGFATDMLFNQTECWSGTEFVDPDTEIILLLRKRVERLQACAMQEGHS